MELSNALNAGTLPAGYIALAEQIVGGPIPDVITLERFGTATAKHHPNDVNSAVAVADAPPKARLVRSSHLDIYAQRANRIAIRHRLGHVVAMIEIVSPGNKNSMHGLDSFVTKARDMLRQHIHLLIVDLFPPTPRDPQGLQQAIWEPFGDEPLDLPPDKRLSAAAFCANEPITAYMEPLAVGDPLPSLPIFLDSTRYVPAPLEQTYQLTWSKLPEPVRELVESGDDLTETR